MLAATASALHYKGEGKLCFYDVGGKEDCIRNNESITLQNTSYHLVYRADDEKGYASVESVDTVFDSIVIFVSVAAVIYIILRIVRIIL